MKLKKTAFIFLIFILILSFSLKVYSLMEPVNSQESTEVMVDIKKGMSGKEISKLLAEKGLIRSSTVFYLLLRFKEIDDLKSGYYRFSTSDSSFEIIEKLRAGQEEIFKITIPEGFTLAEILQRFSELELVEYDQKLLKTEINQAFKKLDLKTDLNSAQIADLKIMPAEGIIIPTTYHFPFSYSEEDIAEYLLSFFAKKRLPILKEAAAEKEFSAYEILIIASLIEEEGKIAAENKIIASVIYNRLAKKMPLQLDATVQYALEQRKERVLYKDLEIKSPYNTYQINKLPPTAIASPGAEALKAAINPAETDYLFYFALEDGSHVFTKSYQEHLRKQQELKGS